MHDKFKCLALATALVIGVALLLSSVVVTPTTAFAQSPTGTPTAAAAQPTQPVTTTTGVRVLRIGEDIYPDVMDPQKSSFVNEIEALNLAYEGLLTIEPDGEIAEGAADRYEFSPDALHMTFHIREGLKRSDGTPITARDFEYALKRAADPRVPGRQYVSLLFDVVGVAEADALDAQTVAAADVQTALDKVGIHATDDQTLVIDFKQPTGDYWAYIAAQPITFPTDKRAVDQDPDNWWKKPENHDGNGPFVFQSIEEGNKITFAPNPNYWRGTPKLERIEISYNPDNAATLEAYKRGDLDIDANVAAEQVSGITSDPTLTVEFTKTTSAQTVALAFNNTRKPFDDRNVRVAFSEALDRLSFVKDQLSGVGEPYTRWIPADVPANQADEPGVPDTDPTAAVNTLVSNGYGTADNKVDCAKLGEIKFTYPDSPINQQRVQYIASNLEKVIGCKITPDPVAGTEFTSLTKDVLTNPQMSLQRWVQDYPHPQNWLSVYWECGAFSRRYGYCNLLMDDILKKADSLRDEDEAYKLYELAEDMLIQDVPGAFMYNPDNLALVKPYVIGPLENLSSRDAGWAGEWGPVWEYDIDLSKVPSTYPKQ